MFDKKRMHAYYNLTHNQMDYSKVSCFTEHILSMNLRYVIKNDFPTFLETKRLM